MKKDFGMLGLCLVAYGITALLLFGSFFSPFFFVFSGRLGAPYWSVLVAASAIVSLICVQLAGGRLRLDYFYRAPAFICIWMGASALSVGIYAEWSRREIVREFRPDDYIRRSFFQSIREAPQDFQFLLHATALKDCKAYGWSYRDMAFYELHSNVAQNVLSEAWMKRCSIARPAPQ